VNKRGAKSFHKSNLVMVKQSLSKKVVFSSKYYDETDIIVLL